MNCFKVHWVLFFSPPRRLNFPLCKIPIHESNRTRYSQLLWKRRKFESNKKNLQPYEKFSSAFFYPRNSKEHRSYIHTYILQSVCIIILLLKHLRIKIQGKKPHIKWATMPQNCNTCIRQILHVKLTFHF